MRREGGNIYLTGLDRRVPLVISGTQWHSVAIGGNQWQLGARSQSAIGNQWQSEAIRGNQWLDRVSLNGNEGSSNSNGDSIGNPMASTGPPLLPNSRELGLRLEKDSEAIEASSG